MHVTIRELVPGCILKEDVYKKTSKPIMRKKTVLGKDHLQILQTFLVQSVYVEPKLVDGTTFKPSQVIKEDREDPKQTPGQFDDQDSFMNRYLRAVQRYKKEFLRWQGRMKIEPYAAREIFLPLYEKEPTKQELMDLHHYSSADQYIFHHAVAVSIYSSLLGRKMGMENADIIQLGLAGLLADCGMARISFDIYKKKDSLNREQYEEVKKHPVFSYRMLEEVPGFNKKALLGVLQHHEREDGSGYPLHVTSQKLHPFAKIIGIADVFHAMSAERRYRKKQSPYRVLELLQTDEFGKLDDTCVRDFLELLLDLSPGSVVRLSNGLSARVVESGGAHPTRPVLELQTGERMDLRTQPNIFITEASLDRNEVTM
ncbi:HD-GYP domain-containing protein [Alkalicoccus urumqiensis]|uniref:HD-GYP domain-containing protein n=1 Tax=Alkalicoccus urumqiensis TaxID=1548213 RepID=A0A2P6MDI7_ALKUR|nr:HD-GYP domain-containing protein [Alkalicoccus urumqiensis]PRO64333.1 HD-GYP domain-containing protein [Alkalicoccus urumqiensis]